MKDFNQIYNDVYKFTLVDKRRCEVLFNLANEVIINNIDGDWFECGVYKGGTAILLKELISEDKQLYLFDSFEGLPEVCEKDNHHKKGDFNDVSFDEVRSRIGNGPIFKRGWIPDTFVGMEDVKLSLAHIDVDIYQSVMDCCEFIYPRMNKGGWMIFDDYGFGSCKGAKVAVEEFFSDKPEGIHKLNTCQATVQKL